MSYNFKNANIRKSRLVKGSLEMFRSVDVLIIEKVFSENLTLKVVIDHLQCLKTEFQKYFPINFNLKKGI